LRRELDDEIKWLNMNLKPDKECGARDYIVFLSEIIANSIWQEIILSTYRFQAFFGFNGIF
jgi:hypothetical protein